MAAGSGSRYGKLKQFDPLGPENEFLMEYSIYDALKSGFNHIVVITQKDKKDFTQNYLEKRLPKNIKLDVIIQNKEDLPENCSAIDDREKPWGTAHAVWSARHIITKPFAVVNADDFYGYPAYQKAFAFYEKYVDQSVYALISYTLKNTLSDNGSVSRGICKTNNDLLISISETLQLALKANNIIDLGSKKTFTGEEQVSMNFWVCTPTIFEKIEQALRLFLKDREKIAKGELYLPLVIQEIIQSKAAKVKVIPSESNWFGITYAADRKKAVDHLNQITKEGQYPSPLWSIPYA
tara:strand:- start:53204 stop:54085 length:882 start_codon:yes stop_codon:yes gene_type:complete